MTVFCSVENNVVSSFMQQDINSSEIVFLLQQDATTRGAGKEGDVLNKLKATDGKFCGLSLLQHGIALFQVMSEPLCIQWLTGGLTYQFIGTEQTGFFPDVVF